jgi:hypothetical protein
VPTYLGVLVLLVVGGPLAALNAALRGRGLPVATAVGTIAAIVVATAVF